MKKSKRVFYVIVILLLLPCVATASDGYMNDITSHPWPALTPLHEELSPQSVLQIIEVRPTMFFTGAESELEQIVAVKIRNDSDHEFAARLTAGGIGRKDATKVLNLIPGTSEFLFHLPDNREAGQVRFSLHDDRDPVQSLLFAWEPTKLWNVYVVQTSHFDYGYMGVQYATLTKRNAILNDVLDFCTATDDWPGESQFRWIVEASFPLSHFLKSHPEREQELIQRIAEGRIEIAAKFVHMHSSTASHEEIIRNLYNSAALADRLQTRIVTAAHNDVDGITWGSVAAWAGAGVRYFTFNPNSFYRGGNILHKTQAPQAYYWMGPGMQRVLTWRSKENYNEANFLLDNLGKTERKLMQLLRNYEEAGFPYDAIQLMQTGIDRTFLIEFTDNASPHLDVCETVRRWNEVYTYPKLICATSSMFFEYMEDNFAGQIPELHGDCPDWWADGVLTGAVAEAKSRDVHHRLIEAEALASANSILGGAFYPKVELRQAWENTLLFDEHTWGLIFPFLTWHDAIWETKVDFVEDAEKACADVSDRALGELASMVRGEGSRLLVFNALSWERDDVITWQLPHGFSAKDSGSDHFRILDTDGNSVPYQYEDGGETVSFIAHQVPSMGYATYQVTPSETPPSKTSELTADSTMLENEYYWIDFDSDNGVTGILDKELGRQLIDADAPYAFGQFISRRQGLFDAFDKRLSGEIIECRLATKGPVYASILCEIEDPHYHMTTITQEIRLYDGLRRIDVICELDEFGNTVGESKYFAFPFDVPDFEFHIDIPGAVMQPTADELPDFAKFYAVQHWIDVSSASRDFGVTWATAHGPMVELGDITKRSGWARSLIPPAYYKPGEYPYEAQHPHIYSEIMNNFQTTNFNYLQMGDGTWSYALTTHEGAWDQPAVTRFGWDLSSPLVAQYFVADTAGALPEVLSFVQVDAPNVKILAFKAAENGNGYLIRLFENEGKVTSATISIPILNNLEAQLVDQVERPLEAITVENGEITVDLMPFGFAAVQVTGDPVDFSEEIDLEPNGDNDEDESDDDACGC